MLCEDFRKLCKSQVDEFVGSTEGKVLMLTRRTPQLQTPSPAISLPTEVNCCANGQNDISKG